jgi:two-component system, LytTR family, response regulator
MTQLKNSIRAIVIDDELYNRGLIVKLITELNSKYNIIGEADGVRSGYELILKMKPDIVFLDIKMPDGNGFELLSLFTEIDFEVVFISGFDEYALKAFEYNALDYVLKPIDSEKFSKTLKKVELRIENKFGKIEDLKTVVKSYDLNELIIAKIAVHSGSNVQLLSIEEIMFIKADDGCTSFKLISNDKYTSSKQLSDFEFIIENHPYMVRITKGVYVNLNYIANYSKGMVCFLTMKDGTSFEISRRKKGEILELLDKRMKK